MWKVFDGELFQNSLVETPVWQEPTKYCGRGNHGY